MIGFGTEIAPAAARGRVGRATRDGAEGPGSNDALENQRRANRIACETAQAFWDACQIIGMHVFDMLLTPPRWQKSEMREIISRSIPARPRRGADSRWRIVRPTDFTGRT